jgi:hypothetical protein
MNDEELQQIRSQTELQFKLMLYKRPEFPFLQSMGTKHLIQEFNSTEQIYIGTLHLWWTNEQDNALYYSVNHAGQKVKGTWKTEWFNSIQEGRDLMTMIQKDSIVDTMKLIKIATQYMMEVHAKREVAEILEKEGSILWN